MEYGAFLSQLEGMDGVAVTVTHTIAKAGDLGEVVITYAEETGVARICYGDAVDTASTPREMEARVRAALVFLEWRNKMLTSWG